jgi:hypothetical protein
MKMISQLVLASACRLPLAKLPTTRIPNASFASESKVPYTVIDIPETSSDVMRSKTKRRLPTLDSTATVMLAALVVGLVVALCLLCYQVIILDFYVYFIQVFIYFLYYTIHSILKGKLAKH